MRAIVIGASGQVGGWLCYWLNSLGHEVVGTYATVPYPGLHQLDAANLPEAAHWVRGQQADVLYYPAGFTWVDGCERDPERSRSANVLQPLNLARTVAERGGRFVYFSTDYVFDGYGGPYSETDPTNPLSIYGKSKLEAERALQDTLGTAQLTARTSWVFGPERQGKNFAYQLIRNLKAGKPVECPSDQISNPSYGPDVAKAVVGLVESGVSGLIHVAGPQVIDRVEFARSIARGFDLDESLISGATTEQLGQSAPRPLNGGLLTPRLDEIDPTCMRSLATTLDDFRETVSNSATWTNPMS